EALARAIGTMRAIGLKQVKARIGNIGILRSFLPFPPADQGVVLHSLDKRNFPMLDAELARLGRKDFAAPLRKLVELSGDASVLNDAGKVLGESAKEGLDYLRDLAGLLDDYGISRSDYAFDMGGVRGLDYCTRMVFEIDSTNLSEARGRHRSRRTRPFEEPGLRERDRRPFRGLARGTGAEGGPSDRSGDGHRRATGGRLRRSCRRGPECLIHPSFWIRDTQFARWGNSFGILSPAVNRGEREPYTPKSARLGSPRIHS